MAVGAASLSLAAMGSSSASAGAVASSSTQARRAAFPACRLRAMVTPPPLLSAAYIVRCNACGGIRASGIVHLCPGDSHKRATALRSPIALHDRLLLLHRAKVMCDSEGPTAFSGALAGVGVHGSDSSRIRG